MKNSYAALLDRNNEVIGLVHDAPKKGNTITVAGCFTVDGSPVNCSDYKISRSKKNMGKADFEQPLSKVGDVWTFYAVNENGGVFC